MKTPKTISYSGETLCQWKVSGNVPAQVLDELRAKADELLSLPPVSVVARNQHPKDGNLHAYASMGPYWWPNPDTPNRLPYVRRDGEKNPETIEKLAGKVDIFLPDLKYADPLLAKTLSGAEDYFSVAGHPFCVRLITWLPLCFSRGHASTQREN